jgi:hypothetical protein
VRCSRTGVTPWHCGKLHCVPTSVRTGLFVAPHPGDPTARVLAVAKKNAGRRPSALGYRVVESPTGQPVIEWTGPVDLTADGLCRCNSETVLKTRDRAIDWLKRELSSGPRKAADLYASAGEAGIPERTLFRAKAALRVGSHRAYDRKEERGEWYWYDPDAEWPKHAPFKKPFEMPPLPEM